jgi:hypothetical protein
MNVVRGDGLGAAVHMYMCHVCACAPAGIPWHSCLCVPAGDTGGQNSKRIRTGIREMESILGGNTPLA